jgi:hypothetical protein
MLSQEMAGRSSRTRSFGPASGSPSSSVRTTAAPPARTWIGSPHAKPWRPVRSPRATSSRVLIRGPSRGSSSARSPESRPCPKYSPTARISSSGSTTCGCSCCPGACPRPASRALRASVRPVPPLRLRRSRNLRSRRRRFPATGSRTLIGPHRFGSRCRPRPRPGVCDAMRHCAGCRSFEVTGSGCCCGRARGW